MVIRVWKLTVALILLGVFGVFAAAPFPMGVWVGWRAASGGWNLPETSHGDTVTVARILLGVLIGYVVFRFGVEMRRKVVLEWQRHRDGG